MRQSHTFCTIILINISEYIWASISVQLAERRPLYVKAKFVADSSLHDLYVCAYVYMHSRCARLACCTRACVPVRTFICMCVSLQVCSYFCVIWLQCSLNSNELSKSMYMFVSGCASICMWMCLCGVCGHSYSVGLYRGAVGVPLVRWMLPCVWCPWLCACVPLQDSILQRQNKCLGVGSPGS